MYSILLLISLAINIFFLIYILQIKDKIKIIKLFIWFSVCAITIISASLLQSIFAPYPKLIKPEFFEYFFYLGILPATVIAFLLSKLYKNPATDIKKYWPFFIPVMFSILLVFTNNFHHLFFVSYSTKISDIVYGPLFIPITIFHYFLAGIAVINFLVISFKNSDSLTGQTLILAFSVIAVIFTNFLATFKIIDLYVYVNGLIFGLLPLAIGLCIVKYKFENVTPIALKTIINTMTDGLVIVNHDGVILTVNKAFEKFAKNTFKINQSVRDKNLYEILGQYDKEIITSISTGIEKSYHTEKLVTKEALFTVGKQKKYFNLDIYAITINKKKLHIGNLILFRDISKHKENIKILQEKQNIIVAQSRLATIGELAGGIAHDINTPISTIKTGIQILNSSFEDEERKALLEQMQTCADRISEIANTVRNQFRNLGKQNVVKFEINKLLQDISVIVHNELKKYNCTLDLNMNEIVSITGAPTKLSQVLTNIIVNAIQVHSGTSGGTVTVNLYTTSKNIQIEVIDKAGGIDPEILPHLFKNILTTKGEKGTGLGLYLSYSVIKSEFNGDIKVDSTQGVGTKFTVILPKG